MLPAAAFPRRPRAFTLLEICIVIALILLLLAVGLPSMSGQLARQRLQGTFDRFDALAAKAQKLSVAENRPYTLVWTRDRPVQLYPADLPAEDRKKHGPTAALTPAPGRDEHYTLVRAASLASKPAEVWTFWPTGNCEPVGVRYEGPAGQWEAVYNPLTAQAKMNTFLAR